MALLDMLDDLEKSVDDRVVDPRFYYVYQSKLLTLLVVSILANIVLFFVILLSVNSRPLPNVYLTAVSGKIIKLDPLKEPVLTKETVGEWARDAMKALYNLDHLQYSSQLEVSRQFFSDEAWKLFETQFDAKIKPELLDKKLLITAAPAKAVVSSEGMLGDKFSWMLEVPIETTWAGATGQPEYVRLLAKLTVSKIPSDPRGIVITQFSVDRTLK